MPRCRVPTSTDTRFSPKKLTCVYEYGCGPAPLMPAHLTSSSFEPSGTGHLFSTRTSFSLRKTPSTTAFRPGLALIWLESNVQRRLLVSFCRAGFSWTKGLNVGRDMSKPLLYAASSIPAPATIALPCATPNELSPLVAGNMVNTRLFSPPFQPGYELNALPATSASPNESSFNKSTGGRMTHASSASDV